MILDGHQWFHSGTTLRNRQLKLISLWSIIRITKRVVAVISSVRNRIQTRNINFKNRATKTDAKRKHHSHNSCRACPTDTGHRVTRIDSDWRTRRSSDVWTLRPGVGIARGLYQRRYQHNGITNKRSRSSSGGTRRWRPTAISRYRVFTAKYWLVEILSAPSICSPSSPARYSVEYTV